MTVRELIKELETCDLDKDAAIVLSFVGETEEGYNFILRNIIKIIENEDVVAIQ